MKQIVILLVISLNLCISPASAQWTFTKGPYGSTPVTALVASGTQLISSTTCGSYYIREGSDVWQNTGIKTYFNFYALNDSKLYVCGQIPGITELDLSEPEKEPSIISYETTKIVLTAGDNLFRFTEFSGFSESEDGGLSWKKYNDGLPQVPGMPAGTYDFTSGEVAGGFILCAANNRIYRNTLTPGTWKVSDTGLPTGDIRLIKYVDGKLFAAIDHTLFRSDDFGEHWIEVQSMPAGISCVATFQQTLYVGTDQGIYVSKDDGGTWEPQNDGLGDLHITALTFWKDLPVCGTAAGGVRVLDGEVWKILGKNLNCEVISALTSSGSLAIAASSDHIFSLQQDDSWTALSNPVTDGPQYINPKYGNVHVKNDTILAGFQYYHNTQLFNSLLYSTDLGNTWHGVGNSSPFPNGPLHIGLDGNRIYGNDGTYFAYSDNLGLTWKSAGYPNCTVSDDFLIDKGNVFILDCGESKILKFNNDPKYPKWLPSGYGIPQQTGLTTLCKTDDALYAFGEEVYVSNNGGSSWSVKGNQLPLTEIRDWVAYGDVLIVAGMEGIFYTKDQGYSWSSMNEGLTEHSVVALDIHQDYLYASIVGLGVAKYPLSELLTAHPDITDSYNKLILYPNPAGDYIMISNPSAKSAVYLVTDMHGRVVATGKAIDKERVNVSGLQSGLYTVSIISGNDLKSGKLVIVR
ncbi:MAG: T9SS type A sorting domain-containing protein [Saprospiraceae bacterium]|nr:T9SS type A sorting domain-containing protein [Saprospiraceae bacterium]